MKTKVLLFLLCLVFVAQAQPPEKFHTRFGGEGIDIGYSVKQTLDKNYIIAGVTSSSGAGNTDIFLTKLDTMGKIVWQKTFGGFSNDVGKSIVQLSDSGYVIAGYTNSFGSGGYDAILIRTDKLGNQVWLRTFGGADWDFGYDLIQLGDDSLVMCGSTSSFGKGKTDAFVCKYDLDGTLLWQKFFGGNEDDDFKGIFSKTGNEIFVCGSTRSHGDILGDMYMFKLNSVGDSLMRIIYGGNLEENGNDVTLDKNNAIYIVGGSNSYTSGQKDGLVVKFSSTGAYLNRTNLGKADSDEEIFKIIPTTSEFGDIVVIYSENQGLGTQVDFLTLAMNDGLFYIPGGQNGSFGFADIDEPYDICSTKDKGYAQVGYTKSLNAIDKDILFVKRDSAMRYGTLVVGLKEKEAASAGDFKIFPNPVNGDDEITIGFKDAYQLKNCRIELFNASGLLVLKTEVEKGKNNLKLPLKELASGVYIMNISVNGANYYYKILKL